MLSHVIRQYSDSLTRVVVVLILGTLGFLNLFNANCNKPASSKSLLYCPDYLLFKLSPFELILKINTFIYYHP